MLDNVKFTAVAFSVLLLVNVVVYFAIKAIIYVGFPVGMWLFLFASIVFLMSLTVALDIFYKPYWSQKLHSLLCCGFLTSMWYIVLKRYQECLIGSENAMTRDTILSAHSWSLGLGDTILWVAGFIATLVMMTYLYKWLDKRQKCLAERRQL
jgi:hypothetical protein